MRKVQSGEVRVHYYGRFARSCNSVESPDQGERYDLFRSCRAWDRLACAIEHCEAVVPADLQALESLFADERPEDLVRFFGYLRTGLGAKRLDRQLKGLRGPSADLGSQPDLWTQARSSVDLILKTLSL